MIIIRGFINKSTIKQALEKIVANESDFKYNSL